MEDRRFHGQLMHVHECLEQATLRTIYGTPYVGEVTVDAIDIRARGVPVRTDNVRRGSLSITSQLNFEYLGPHLRPAAVTPRAGRKI